MTAAVEPAGRRRRPRPAHGHHQAVRRDAGPGRRVARPPGGRGPRARRRERGRQEHAGQDHGRRPPARQRHDPDRRRADGDHRPGPRPGARDRGRPPGAAPVPRPQRRRERVHRPRAVGSRSGPSTGARPGGPRRRCSRSSTSGSTSGAPVRGLSMADQQLIEIAKALSVDARRADPRRADRVPVGARGRAAVHDRARPARSGRRDPVRQPPPGRGLRPVRHRDGVPRRAPRHHDRHQRAHRPPT